MTRLMSPPLCLLACALAGVSAGSDDPPKALSPAERKAFEAKWLESMLDAAHAHQAGKYTEAAKANEVALGVARRLYPKDEYPAGHAQLATSLNNLALLYQARGRLADAEPLLRDAAAMYARLHKGDHPQVATGLNNLATLYEALGKLGDAEQPLKDAVAMLRRMHEAEDHPQTAVRLATGLGNLGRLYQKQGKLAEAEPPHTAAVALYRQVFKVDFHLVATGLANLASVYHDQGRLTEAEPLYAEALAMRKRLFPGDHPDVAHGMNRLGGLYREQGRLAEAGPLLGDALVMFGHIHKGDHPDVASAMGALASLHRDRGQLAEAEPLYAGALAMRKRLFPGDHPDVAHGMSSLASLYRTRGQLAEAEPLFADALAMYRGVHPGDHPAVARGMSNLAALHQCRGNLARAAALYADALAMYKRLLVAYARQRSEGQALTLAASQPPTRDPLLSVLRARTPDAANSDDAAAAYAAVWATKGVGARVYEQRQLQARAATDPALVRELGELADARRRRANLLLAPATKDPGTLRLREDYLKALDKAISRLDESLPRQLPAVARADKLDAATVTDLRQALPADAALVDYVRYTHVDWDDARPAGQKERRTPRYLAFVVTRGRVAWVDLDAAAAIEPAVAAWRGAITGDPARGHRPEPAERAAELGKAVRDRVWAKVREALPAGTKTVYLCPDAALCRLPFAALPGDRPGTVLLEDYALATVPHAPFLLDRLWPQDPPTSTPAAALVVGGVGYDAVSASPARGPVAGRADPPVAPGTGPSWSPLPNTVGEADGVAAAAARGRLAVTRLGGDRATAAAVLEALPRAKVAHLATHGFFADPTFRSAFRVDEAEYEQTSWGERRGRAALSPLVMTGLVFAGSNHPGTPGRGVLTGESLVDLDLTGLELAVLSACETGLGDVAGGEGTFGLQRAFHYAGARDVVVSLWKVPDEGTAALMALFYRNLWENRLTPVEALRQAQLAVYREPARIPDLAAGFRGKFEVVPGAGAVVETGPAGSGRAHPMVWAAFSLSGPGR